MSNLLQTEIDMPPQILGKATLGKDGQTKTIVVAYFPELDQPNTAINPAFADDSLQPSPYKTLKYHGMTVVEEWEYSYKGRAGNRYHNEIGKAICHGWMPVSIQGGVLEDAD